MTISVLIPTYRRPLDLHRCLAALAAQTRPAEEILVVVRDTDTETQVFLADAAPPLPGLRLVSVGAPGVLTAMTAGLAQSTGDIVALTDDDTAPYPDWLARIEAHFNANPNVGGVGGRDWQPNDHRSRAVVGKIQWHGRVIGNHHLGVGGPREVDILKGANCAYRAEPLKKIGLDTRLRGEGAQAHWELALGMAMRQGGWKLIYDPEVALDHFIAQRFDEDTNHRGFFQAAGLTNSVHNETLVLLTYLSPPRRMAFLVWAFFVGTRVEPGLLQVLRLLRRREKNIGKRLSAVYTGRLAAIRANTHLQKLMKIAIIMPLAEQRGGAELALLHLMQQGQGLGVDWLVIFLADGPMVQQVRELGGEAVVVDAGRLREVPKFAGAALAIAKIARREKVSLIFGWMGIAQLYGGLAARLAGVPCAWFQHGIPLDKKWMDRLATRIPALGILTCSQAVADAQREILPNRTLRVVHPGVELKRFDPAILPTPCEAKRRLGLPLTGPLIGIVGRLQRWKGMHVLIEALPEVLKTHPDAHVVVVGGDHAPEPNYPAFLRERISALGLAGKVTFAGLQSNVPEWMQAMDIIVHASDREPFGIVVIEAMALGKPVIAGNAAGPTEIITDGVHGLLTPYGNAPALASALRCYLDDPDFAGEMGAAARQRALEFSTRRYAENCVAALRELMAQNGSKP